MGANYRCSHLLVGIRAGVCECNGQREAAKRLRAGRVAVRGIYGYTSATDSEKAQRGFELGEARCAIYQIRQYRKMRG